MVSCELSIAIGLALGEVEVVSSVVEFYKIILICNLFRAWNVEDSMTPLLLFILIGHAFRSRHPIYAFAKSARVTEPSVGVLEQR